MNANSTGAAEELIIKVIIVFGFKWGEGVHIDIITYNYMHYKQCLCSFRASSTQFATVFIQIFEIAHNVLAGCISCLCNIVL